MRALPFFALFAIVLSCSLFAAPAYAQRDRVFVASYGSDSNPCTFGSPCKTFQQAVSVVAAGGEVTAIDSAGFGPLTINQSVTITSPAGVEAGIAAASGGTAITIAAASADKVVLRGLTLEGAGVADYGITFSSGWRLEVIGCTVHNFTSDGIFVNASEPMSVLIANTVVSDMGNSGDGIYFYVPTSGASIIAAVDQSIVSYSGLGVAVYAGSGPVELLISDSHIDNNLGAGIKFSGGSFDTTAFLKNVTVNQAPDGIVVNGNTTLYLSQVTQTAGSGFDSTSSITISGSGNTVYGDGTNHLSAAPSGGNIGTWPSY
jgi:hypothetical protein